MISLRTEKVKCGNFRSYVEVGHWLAENGETGTYYVIPQNIHSLLGMKEIRVKKYWDEENQKWDREIEMEGSLF